MIRLITAFTITSTLLLAQGWSLSPRTEEKPVGAATKQGEGHSMGNGETHNSAESNPHGGHSMGDEENSAQAQAKLTAPRNITPNTPVTLAIDIRGSDGKAITKFDTFQEKLMHLIAVSDNLQFFSHLHPNYRARSYPENQISEAVTQQPSQPENPASDKSQYNLFNPTPRRLWREFSTDRPDKTETPFTVDAGRVTMEADLFVYTRDTNSPDGTRTESFNYFVPNFKVGLLNNIDLQIIPEVYNVVRTTPKGSPTQERSGFGDLTVRMKINFWGNDGGQTAFGMMPFIKFPTNQNNLGNNSIEGGIIFPLAIGLSDKWKDLPTTLTLDE